MNERYTKEFTTILGHPKQQQNRNASGKIMYAQFGIIVNIKNTKCFSRICQ